MKMISGWIELKKIASIHKVSDNIKLLAATQKLQKSAYEWLDLDVEVINEFWNIFSYFQEITEKLFPALQEKNFQEIMTKSGVRKKMDS